MIKTTHSVTFRVNSNHLGEQYSLDPAIQTNDFTHIAVQNIFVPKNTYQLNDDLVFVVDGVQITLHQGNITFQDLILRIRAAVGAGYTVEELHSTDKQSTGKIRIKKTNNTAMTFVINDENPVKASFFGNMAIYDVGTGSEWRSSNICNLLQSKLLIIRSNAVHSPFNSYQSFSDVLCQVQLDTTNNYSYFSQQNIDILHSKKVFSKQRDWRFQFFDENLQPFAFKSNQPIILEIVLFQYAHDHFHTLHQDLTKLQLLQEQSLSKSSQNNADAQARLIADQQKMHLKTKPLIQQ